MRRQIIEKTKDESSEKQKRNALVHSIAVESQLLGDLKDETLELQEKIEELKKTSESISIETFLAKGKLTEVTHNITEKEASLKTVSAKVAEVDDRIAKLIKEETEISLSLRAMQEEFNDEMARIGEKITTASAELSVITKEAESLTDKKERAIMVLISTENQLTQSITDKKREVESLDGSIAKRLAEIAQINKNIAENKNEEARAHQEVVKADARIEKVKEELATYDKQLSDKTTELSSREEEVQNKREELLSLVVKEKRINEKEGAIRELFKLAGIEVKL